MSVRKRNEFLDGDDSDDGGEDVDFGYQSDAVEDSRGALTGQKRKKRRTAAESDEESFRAFDDEQEGGDGNGSESEISGHGDASTGAGMTGDSEGSLFGGNDAKDRDEQRTSEGEDDGVTTTHPLTTKPPVPKSVAAAEKAARKSGVLYVSRVPPFMKPQTLRHFLTPYAPKGLGRIFLTPEDHTTHVQRVKRGGNKKKSFTDGWVEFTSRTEARNAAEMLNGNIIGGKKGNFYHDDLWNVKYLRGFKWGHLTEQIANENAERAARLREEVRRTRKENKAFLEDVERGKMLEGMESKRKAKMQGGEGGSGEGVMAQRAGRKFEQRKVRVESAHERGGEQSAELKQVLGKIF